MSSPTVRISATTRDTLRLLADEEQRPMQSVLDEAVEIYRRQKILEVTRDGYAALRGSPEQYAEYRKEVEPWDDALADGIESD